MSSMPRAKRPRRVGRAGLYALLVVGCIPTILPLVWLVRSALMSDGQIFTSPPEWIPDPWMFRNFPDLFAAQPFATYFLNSAVIVVLNIVGTLLSQLFTVGGSFVLLFLSSISTATWLGVYAVSMLAPPAVVLILARARAGREAKPPTGGGLGLCQQSEGRLGRPFCFDLT